MSEKTERTDLTSSPTMSGTSRRFPTPMAHDGKMARGRESYKRRSEKKRKFDLADFVKWRIEDGK